MSPLIPPGGLAWLLLASGLAWGSFLGQLHSRLSWMALPPGQRPPLPGLGGRPLSLLHPSRSFCFHCGQPIPWQLNLPVFSWLALKGRGRCCGQPLGGRTLAVEALTPLWLLALHQPWGLAWGFGWPWALAAAGWSLAWGWPAPRPKDQPPL